VLAGSCHCGAVGIRIPEVALEFIDCNCSICRRLGALWALYDARRVQIDGRPDDLDAYVWGRKTIATFRCRRCGCATHWESLPSAARPRVGVNMRMFDHDIHAGVRIRRFDGADSWTYLD
jgi:hypothetical protein